MIRLTAEKPGMPDDPASEYRISPLANRTGRAVMSLERTLIKGGVSFPAGGSLLVVSWPLRAVIARTDTWLAISGWLTS